MITFNFVLRSDFSNSKGEAPISLRIIGKNSSGKKKKKDISMRMKVRPEIWNPVRQRIDSKQQSEIDKNYILSKEESKCSDILTRYRLMGITPTIEEFEDLYKRYQEKLHLTSFIEHTIKEIAEKRAVSKSTITQYLTFLDCIKKLFPALPLSQLSLNHIEHLDGYLINQGYAHNTRWKYHKNFKKFVHLADKKNLLFRNPYTEFKIKKGPGRIVYLESYELEKMIAIYKEDIPETYKKALARYLFSFYCCGLRISDIQRVGWEDISGNNLRVLPKKTARFLKVLDIPVTEQMLSYIENSTGLFFTRMPEATINKALKEVAKLCNIHKPVTFHTARHTFATLFLESGGKIEVLKDLLGHSKMEDTMVYVHISRSRKKSSLHAMFDYIIR